MLVGVENFETGYCLKNGWLDAQGEQKKGIRGGGVSLQVRWSKPALTHTQKHTCGNTVRVCR